MDIRNSQEDYLEAILVLSQGGGPVRSVNIADHMGFSRASISRAISLLVESGYVQVGKQKEISLTVAGYERARQIYEKHRFFKQLLLRAGVDEATAARDACRIEHAISDESFQAIKEAFVQSQKTDGVKKQVSGN